MRAADGIRTRDKSLEGYCVTPTPLPQSRGGQIRTDDLSDPNRALYQAELRPDVFKADGKYTEGDGYRQYLFILQCDSQGIGGKGKQQQHNAQGKGEIKISLACFQNDGRGEDAGASFDVATH